MSDELGQLRDALTRAHDALDAEHGHTIETWRDRQHLRARLDERVPLLVPPASNKAYKLDAHEVGRRIKQRRAELGLSQREIAFEGGSYAYVSRLESGHRNPSIGMLITLAERLQTTALWLAVGDRFGFCPVCQRGGTRWVIELDEDFALSVALDGVNGDLAELVERSAAEAGVPLKRVT